ncbi:MAG: DUF1127 domain-containing protein [Rhizobiaceae bacterium]
MTVLKDVVSELVSMFVGDARLSVAILAIVAAAAGTTSIAAVDPLLGGAILLGGCLLLLVGVVYVTARRHWSVQATGFRRNEVLAIVEIKDTMGLLDRAAFWFARLHQRRALRELDEHLLDDIGVSKTAAEEESRRLD